MAAKKRRTNKSAKRPMMSNWAKPKRGAKKSAKRGAKKGAKRSAAKRPAKRSAARRPSRKAGCRTVSFRAKGRTVNFEACFKGTRESRERKRSMQAKSECHNKKGQFVKCGTAGAKKPGRRAKGGVRVIGMAGTRGRRHPMHQEMYDYEMAKSRRHPRHTAMSHGR